MAYRGSIELVSGITPKNGGNFPLVNAEDVQVGDQESSRLSNVIQRYKDNIHKLQREITYYQVNGSELIITLGEESEDTEWEELDRILYEMETNIYTLQRSIGLFSVNGSELILDIGEPLE